MGPICALPSSAAPFVAVDHSAVAYCAAWSRTPTLKKPFPIAMEIVPCGLERAGALEFHGSNAQRRVGALGRGRARPLVGTRRDRGVSLTAPRTRLISRPSTRCGKPSATVSMTRACMASTGRRRASATDLTQRRRALATMQRSSSMRCSRNSARLIRITTRPTIRPITSSLISSRPRYVVEAWSEFSRQARSPIRESACSLR